MRSACSEPAGYAVDHAAANPAPNVMTRRYVRTLWPSMVSHCGCSGGAESRQRGGSGRRDPRLLVQPICTRWLTLVCASQAALWLVVCSLSYSIGGEPAEGRCGVGA